MYFCSFHLPSFNIIFLGLCMELLFLPFNILIFYFSRPALCLPDVCYLCKLFIRIIEKDREKNVLLLGNLFIKIIANDREKLGSLSQLI